MAKRATQTDIPGMEQKRIPKIEHWSAKFDAKRELVAKIAGERDNAELKFIEAMHENAADLSHEEGKHGEEMLVYRRGDYNVATKKGREKALVKIGEKSKGEGLDDAEEGDA